MFLFFFSLFLFFPFSFSPSFFSSFFFGESLAPPERRMGAGSPLRRAPRLSATARRMRPVRRGGQLSLTAGPPWRGQQKMERTMHRKKNTYPCLHEFFFLAFRSLAFRTQPAASRPGKRSREISVPGPAGHLRT